MHEALMLFESIANSRYFEKSGLVLFLNKLDLFTEKVSAGRGRIRDHFPDYTGSNTDVAAGEKFFADKFRNLVREKTMKSVQDMIVQRNLHSLML
jgi:guanine nucleotide-binding protein subunit alpha